MAGEALPVVETVADVPTPSVGVDSRTPQETPAGTRERVNVFLAETRYFLSTLEHEVVGEAAEIIDFLKAKLL